MLESASFRTPFLLPDGIGDGRDLYVVASLARRLLAFGFGLFFELSSFFIVMFGCISAGSGLFGLAAASVLRRRDAVLGKVNG